MGTKQPVLPPIDSGRLVLRRVRAEDEHPIGQAVSDADIQRWIQPPADYAKSVYQRAVRRESRGAGRVWAITVGGHFAGIVGYACNDDDVAEIGFWLARPFRGQGVAKRAVGLASAEALDHAQRLIARVPLGNDASVAVLLACGYTKPVPVRLGLARREGHIDCWAMSKELRPSTCLEATE